ncbi:hypothetical protein Tco_1041470, partial [Tanacetum coccineum]
KLHKARGQINDEQKVLLESISVLLSRCLFRESHFPVSPEFVATMINQNLTGLAFGAFPVELDVSMKNSTIVRGLKIAFIRTRLVPQLHRKKIEADLEASVVEFFSNLPNVATLCISMLEDDSDFLSNLLPPILEQNQLKETYIRQILSQTTYKKKSDKAGDPITGGIIP